MKKKGKTLKEKFMEGGTDELPEHGTEEAATVVVVGFPLEVLHHLQPPAPECRRTIGGCRAMRIGESPYFRGERTLIEVVDYHSPKFPHLGHSSTTSGIRLCNLCLTGIPLCKHFHKKTFSLGGHRRFHRVDQSSFDWHCSERCIIGGWKKSNAIL
ncbi:hypothetical protein PIB30_061865 [Stylosanthes scabra]|uniref:C2H2-type domain-containing protein n=1 Tax=Stylosanthes scabra TaxID=79078 RepID=A0ABU6XLX1_9FABA|nr:hypothetical protein [Stylosanthes scabra]